MHCANLYIFLPTKNLYVNTLLRTLRSLENFKYFVIEQRNLFLTYTIMHVRFFIRVILPIIKRKDCKSTFHVKIPCRK